jgi:shikimate kinase
MNGGRGFRGVVLVGFMGSGKTSVGKEIARRLGVPFEDIDDRIEASAGISVAEIFASRGEPAFRELERRAIRDAVAVPGKVVATGGGAFLDEGNRKVLKAYAAVVFLDVSPGSVMARLAGDRSRPLLPGRPPGLSARERDRRIEELMLRRRAAYEMADFTVDTDAGTVEQAADRVLALVADGETPGAAPDARGEGA